MKTVLMADPVRYLRMTTEELRETFLLGSLCEAGKIHLNYVDLDRSVAGFAAPADAAIVLPSYPELRANYFTERRELGALNIGGAGSISVEGKSYEMNNLDVLYIGRGNKEVSFASKDKSAPAVFYLLSYSAHADYPTDAGSQRRSEPGGTGQRGDVQQADDLQIHSPAGCAQLPTGDGRDAPGAGQQLEHDAAAYAHAPIGNLHVLQRRSECAGFPSDGTAG